MQNQEVQMLMDFSVPFDQQKVGILDRLTNMLYKGSPEMIQNANQLISQLKNNPNFWMQVGSIMQYSNSVDTKFISMLVLEDAIKVDLIYIYIQFDKYLKTKWQIVNESNRANIKNYILNLVITLASQDQIDKSSENLLNKANLIIVQVLLTFLYKFFKKIAKHEWNTTWKSFVQDIVQSSWQNQNLCENNLQILKLLSEEIFDYSKQQLTSYQISVLKQNMMNDFKQIFDLCCHISIKFLENPSNLKKSLQQHCLETIYTYLYWIPIQYVTSNLLIDKILIPFLDHQLFRNICLKCLTEIVSIPISQFELIQNYQELIFYLYVNAINKIQTFLPQNNNLSQHREELIKSQQQNSQVKKLLTQFEAFSSYLCQFLTSFFSNHLSWIENIFYSTPNINQQQFMDLIQTGFQLIINLTKMQDDHVFKICIDFWNNFVSKEWQKQEQYYNSQQLNYQQYPLNMGLNQQFVSLQDSKLYIDIYQNIFKQLRYIIIGKMTKPKDVLIEIDEYGIPQREQQVNTENIALYEIMKETLIQLCKLDQENTKQIIVSKLDKQLDGTEFSFENLSSLCWSIGCINGILPENDERHFVIIAIKTLLSLCEIKKGKDNKAVVASNIMYVVGSYPKFLISNWNFLRTVVRKLFEFMHETFPGVMEMACNTFLNIVIQCSSEFVKIHPIESNQQDVRCQSSTSTVQQMQQEPYIYELIRKMPQETADLPNPLKLIYYEALGHIISKESSISKRSELIQLMINDALEIWKLILNAAQQNSNVLFEDKNVELISFFFKINERIAFSVGTDYGQVLNTIFKDINSLYSYYSNFIKNEIESKGQQILNLVYIKKLIRIKKDIVRLINTFVSKTKDIQFVSENVIASCMDILQDYSISDQLIKEPDVLLLFSTIIETCQNILTGEKLAYILQVIFNSTLNMLIKDFQSFPDIRMNFFAFLRSIIKFSFQSIIYFNNLIIFSLKHYYLYQAINLKPCFIVFFGQSSMNCQLYLILGQKLFMKCCLQFYIISFAFIYLKKLKTTHLQLLGQFCEIYYMIILQDIMQVLLDGFHQNGFKLQVEILKICFEIIECNQIQNAVAIELNGDFKQNKLYISNFLQNGLIGTYKNVSQENTVKFVNNLFLKSDSIQGFKTIVRDYLILLNQSSNTSENMDAPK